MQLDLERALAWRSVRHALQPVSGTDVGDVLDRVVALRGWPAELGELAIGIRQAAPDPGELGRALEGGSVICSYAFRGGSYVFTPEVGAVLLSARNATRIWQTARYQQQGGFSLDDWEPLRDAIRELLAAGPKTREQIGAHLRRLPALRHLAGAATGAGADSLYKPLHWWGDICFGPPHDGQSTFRLLAGDPRWPGLLDVDDAGRRAIVLYLGAYGPATPANLTYWLTEGLGVPGRRLRTWITDLGDQVTDVIVDGVHSYALTTSLDELSAAEPSDAVRLLPGFDPWVMGPGTADARIVAPERRSLASRGANLVIRGGVVCGTWRASGPDVSVAWFAEAGPARAASLDREVQRLAGLRGKALRLVLEPA